MKYLLILLLLSSCTVNRYYTINVEPTPEFGYKDVILAVALILIGVVKIFF